MQTAYGKGPKLLKIRSVPLSPCSDPGPELYSGSRRPCPILTGPRGCPGSLTPDCSCSRVTGTDLTAPRSLLSHQTPPSHPPCKPGGGFSCVGSGLEPPTFQVAEGGERVGFQELAFGPPQLSALSTEQSQTHNHPLKITCTPS